MNSCPHPGLAEQYAAALDWWREAGVDMDFADTPTAWLSEPQQDRVEERQQAVPPVRKAAPAPPPAPRIGGDRDGWPASLDQFVPWWMAQPLLGPQPGRVPPRGAANADLMVLVPMPEAADTDRLLSGPEGALVSGMLRAMGIAGDAAYVASALPVHQPLPDWGSLAQAGLGEILLHHIALAAPRRVIVLGSDLLPLIGLEKRQGVREVPVNGTSVQLLSSYAPEYLLASAKARAGLWRRWLEWTVVT